MCGSSPFLSLTNPHTCQALTKRYRAWQREKRHNGGQLTKHLESPPSHLLRSPPFPHTRSQATRWSKEEEGGKVMDRCQVAFLLPSPTPFPLASLASSLHSIPSSLHSLLSRRSQRLTSRKSVAVMSEKRWKDSQERRDGRGMGKRRWPLISISFRFLSSLRSTSKWVAIISSFSIHFQLFIFSVRSPVPFTLLTAGMNGWERHWGREIASHPTLPVSWSLGHYPLHKPRGERVIGAGGKVRHYYFLSFHISLFLSLPSLSYHSHLYHSPSRLRKSQPLAEGRVRVKWVGLMVWEELPHCHLLFPHHFIHITSFLFLFSSLLGLDVISPPNDPTVERRERKGHSLSSVPIFGLEVKDRSGFVGQEEKNGMACRKGYVPNGKNWHKSYSFPFLTITFPFISLSFSHLHLSSTSIPKSNRKERWEKEMEWGYERRERRVTLPPTSGPPIHPSISISFFSFYFYFSFYLISLSLGLM